MMQNVKTAAMTMKLLNISYTTVMPSLMQDITTLEACISGKKICYICNLMISSDLSEQQEDLSNEHTYLYTHDKMYSLTKHDIHEIGLYKT